MFDDLNVYVLDYKFKVLCKGNKNCSNGTIQGDVHLKLTKT